MTVTPSEKRHIGGFFDAYLPLMAYLAIVGWIGLIQRNIVPQGTHNYVPPWLIYVWVAAFALGGTVAFAAGLRRHARAESSGLVFVALGLLGYIGLVLRLYGFSWMIAEACLGPLAIFASCMIRLRVLRFARISERIAAQLRLEARYEAQVTEERDQ